MKQEKIEMLFLQLIFIVQEHIAYVIWLNFISLVWLVTMEGTVATEIISIAIEQ